MPRCMTMKRWLSPLVGLAMLLGACQEWGWRPVPPEPAPPPRPAADDDLLRRGTIGSETLLATVEPQPLRGFGLVIGLDGRGSSDCPSVIRDYLVEFLGKQVGSQARNDRNRRPTPGELIDSLDTAVVEVTGAIPAGACKGARFDLQVRALPGTATRSLEGGLLLPTELRYFDRAASGQGLIEGRVLAEAGGPIFVNPFADPDKPTAETDPRQGTVLGGGRAIEEQPLRLMLLRPNYQLTQNIARRVNERFGHDPKTAEAMSVGFVDLHTPPALARQPERFRRTVAQLYVDNRPSVVEQRLRELTQRALLPGADLERIATTWEGVGRTVLPHIQPLYASADPGLRFYAARTGVRLADASALPVLGAIAAAAAHGHRLLAVRELGSVDSPQAAQHLVPLLSDPDQEVRVAAYEALLQHGHPAIRSTNFRHALDPSQINFVLDVVDADGPALIYVRRARLGRIAVFGSRTPIIPPIFYSGPDDLVTIHTVEGSDDIRLFAKRRGRLSDQIVLPPRVVDLIKSLADAPQRDEAGRLRGIGLPYSRVVKIVATLSEQQAIPARLVLEQTSLTELLGPDTTPDRFESDRPEADRPQSGTVAGQ